MNHLPEGWAYARADAIKADSFNALAIGPFGSNLKVSDYRDDGVPLVFVRNIRAKAFDPCDLKYVSEAKAATLRPHAVERGDILVTKMGDPPGDTAIYPLAEQGVVTADCIKLTAHPAVDARYIMYALTSPAIKGQILRITQGVAQPKMSLARFRSGIEIPLAPTAEQRRIVAAIEEQFSRIDAGVAALRRARQNLKRMRAAVLHAAVMGRLVEHDLSEPSLAPLMSKVGVREPERADQAPNWITASIGSLARVTSGATPSRSREEYWSDGSIPWVTSALMNNETIHQAKEFVTATALRETSIKLMPPGTLLVAMYGEGQTRGRCAELLVEATTNQACAAIVIHEELESIRPYVKLALLASYEANRQLSAGGVQPNLSVGIIKDLQIALPPVAEQARICEEVSRQTAFISLLENELDAQSKHPDRLRSSILSTAFSGQFVGQDPSDESVSVLLARIATERISSNGHKPSRNGTRRTGAPHE